MEKESRKFFIYYLQVTPRERQVRTKYWQKQLSSVYNA